MNSLAQDKSEVVRENIANSLYEICKIFSQTNSLKSLEPIIFSLLKDDSHWVLSRLLSHIEEIPQLYQKAMINVDGTPNPDKTFDFKKF